MFILKTIYCADDGIVPTSTTTEIESPSTTDNGTSTISTQESSTTSANKSKTSKNDILLEKCLPFIGNALESALPILADIEKNQFRWATGAKKFGYGESILDRRLNTPATFKLVGQVLPDA